MSFNHLKAMAFATSAAVALVGSAAWAQAPARAQFDIPAQDLGAALRSLGVQAGREVLFDPALVDGLRAPAPAPRRPNRPKPQLQNWPEP